MSWQEAIDAEPKANLVHIIRVSFYYKKTMDVILDMQICVINLTYVHTLMASNVLLKCF